MVSVGFAVVTGFTGLTWLTFFFSADGGGGEGKDDGKGWLGGRSLLTRRAPLGCDHGDSSLPIFRRPKPSWVEIESSFLELSGNEAGEGNEGKRSSAVEGVLDVVAAAASEGGSDCVNPPVNFMTRKFDIID